MASCQPKSDQGHPHDSDGGHDNEARERPAVAYTKWTAKTELFVEFPALTVGNTSRFAAHFTVLNGHQPVRKGQVTVSLIKGKKGIRHTVKSPASPGIFTPALQPLEAGIYQLIFDLKTPKYSDRIVLPGIEVFESMSKAQAAISAEEDGGAIAFLKEQAWKIDFQTAPVKKDTVYGLLKLAGKWIPTPGAQQAVSASSSGNVLFEMPGLVEGVAVSKNQMLMRISGKELNVNSIESEVQKARARYEQAKNEYERKKKLHKLKVVPTAEFEAVEKRLAVVRADYQQLVQNYGTGGLAIRAPFDGYLKDIAIKNGAFANAGQPLLTIGKKRTTMIKATAAASMQNKIKQTQKIWIMQNGRALPVNGKVVSIGSSVTENQPLLSVFLEVATPVTALEGSLAEVQLGYSSGKTGLLIPKDALLEDFGSYKVIVQTGGETFEMLSVKVGDFNGDWVSITQGLEMGDWVVTKGAYQVKMASMSGAPAHGHAH